MASDLETEDDPQKRHARWERFVDASQWELWVLYELHHLLSKICEYRWQASSLVLSLIILLSWNWYCFCLTLLACFFKLLPYRVPTNEEINAKMRSPKTPRRLVSGYDSDTPETPRTGDSAKLRDTLGPSPGSDEK